MVLVRVYNCEVTDWEREECSPNCYYISGISNSFDVDYKDCEESEVKTVRISTTGYYQKGTIERELGELICKKYSSQLIDASMALTRNLKFELDLEDINDEIEEDEEDEGEDE